MVENELAFTRGSLSQTQMATRTSDKILFWCKRSITTSLEIQEWNDGAEFWALQKLPPLLSANQELRKQTHFHFSQTLSHTILFSLTHTTIFSCINNCTLTYTTILSNTTILSHIHYYSPSHTLLFSLTFTTILSQKPNYTLSHTLLYSLTYTTILSHIHYYSLTYTTIPSNIL